MSMTTWLLNLGAKIEDVLPEWLDSKACFWVIILCMIALGVWF
jgi:hypothetical protein